MFSTLSKTEIIISATRNLSSANAFNLDQAKNLSFGKELILNSTTSSWLLTKQQIFRLVSIENICRWQNKFDKEIEFFLRKGRKNCGKRRKCWLQAFSPFPKMFSKDFFWKVEIVWWRGKWSWESNFIENIVGKGEIVGNLLFFSFLAIFSTLSTAPGRNAILKYEISRIAKTQESDFRAILATIEPLTLYQMTIL